MSFKQKIFEHCLNFLNVKIHSLRNILEELSESASNETKSTAGDKHETARAHIQIEQENISKRLNEALDQRSQLERVGLATSNDLIAKGSLIEVNNAYIFLSVAIGKVEVENKEVIVISPSSPLGSKMLNRKKGETFSFNGINYSISNIF